MMDKHEEAVQDFTKVILKNPKNAHAYFRRAFSMKSMKKYDESAGDFEKARSLDPENPRLIVNYKKIGNVKTIVLCMPGKEKIF